MNTSIHRAPDLRLELDRIARLAHRMTAFPDPVVVPTSTVPGRAPFRHEVDVLGGGLMDPEPGEVCHAHAHPSANGRCHGRCVESVRLGMCAACLVHAALADIASTRALEAS